MFKALLLVCWLFVASFSSGFAESLDKEDQPEQTFIDLKTADQDESTENNSPIQGKKTAYLIII